MIEITGLKKRFGQQEILKGIDLTIEEGEVIALIGRSGCGKSTLLRCINFLEEYHAGTISMDGVELWYRCDKNGNRVRRSTAEIAACRQLMGVVFQQFNLFPHMTALQNVCLGPRYSQKVKPDLAESIGRKVLTDVGLAEKVDAYPNYLSGGQQQRVAIARALAMRAKVLLLDEITSALDPQLVGEVEDVIRNLTHEGITMILVTHSMSLAREVSHRIAFIDDGLICEIGTPEQVLDRPSSPKLNEFLSI